MNDSKATRFPFLLVLASCLMGFSLGSCFTGVEGTKRIELSRSDRRRQNRSLEQSLMDSVHPQPLSRWERGRRFYVSDNRASLVLSPRDGYAEVPLDSLAGKVLSFEEVSSRRLPDGSEVGVISFSVDGRILDYVLSRSLRSALSYTRSDALPMMTDLDMVRQAADLLRGRRVWTRSQLWYDSAGSRIMGNKFVPVTITDVSLGNSVFPLSVSFQDSEGDTSSMLMNFGHGGGDSRSFESLFSLSDPKSKYPSIRKDVWQLICEGRVKKGMSKEECRLSLGAPEDVSAGHDWNRTFDVWKYSDGRYLVFSDGLLSDFRL